MENKSKQAEVEASADLGWSFLVLVIIAGVIGRFFGLIGGAVFLGAWWLCNYLHKKNK